MVWCKQTHNLNTIIMDALRLASIFDLEVCLFGCYHNKKKHKKLQHIIQLYSSLISKNVPSAKLSVLILEGRLQNLVQTLGDEYDTLLFCAGSKMNNEIWNAFYKAQFPFYFSAKGASSAQKNFEKVSVPVDFRKSTQDALLWSSYFARFHQSKITLHVANDSSNYREAQQTNANLESALKLYQTFGYSPTIKNSTNSSYRIHSEAQKVLCDLLIFSASSNITLPDKIFGTFEKKIINRKKRNVLLTNPKKEMYVMCD